MKHTICNQVRFEIDEKDLAATLSAGAMEHLTQCVDCREFQTKETRLRQIVGSLETVNAPADFDFRLRARLANDERAIYRESSPIRVWRLRSIAVAAMLLIFAGTVFMLRQMDPREPKMGDTGQASQVQQVAPAPRPDEAATVNSGVTAQNAQEGFPIVAAQKNTQPRRGVPLAVGKRQSVAVDLSSKPAPVIRGESIGTMSTFPLDVSQQSFKVSLDDGSGGSRTISVPTVSFGSRRVLMGGSVSANQYAPKGDW